MTYKSANIIIKPLDLSEAIISIIKQQLSGLEWSFLLESSNTQHVDSNWSIYTADPIATLTDIDRQTLFHDRLTDITKVMENDPLKAQSRIRKQFFHDQQIEQFPFVGGVMATYHYEMGEKFENINHQESNNGLGLAPYYCGFYDWAILFNVETEQYYLVQQRCKHQTEDINLLYTKRLQWLIDLGHGQIENEKAFRLSEQWLANYTEQEYRDSFKKIQEYILSGDCYQVNLAQRFQATYTGNEYNAYLTLLEENKAPFAAFIRLPNQAIISLSPERFLQLDKGVIQTKPIKGTMPRGLDEHQDLLNKQQLSNSEKDQAENLMIVDLLRNDIGKVSKPGTVKVPKLFNIESFPAVHHLVSTVTGELAPEYTCEDLLRACFPGGSITGAPKIRSMEIIYELEKYFREIYCGSIAYINGNGDMDSSITIRTLVCTQGHIYCWAGGGIVADSIVENEYQECFDKVSKILPVLAALT
ncbi:aminodeoxychorismate synthase component I [Psychromonas aquatilis]|uniref:aminodeoxychorismate synthase n=1 Tax=Psychromonas aquatilis TaxID=2005072 RepID=A0ABU9GMQ9_9GAMM